MKRVRRSLGAAEMAAGGADFLSIGMVPAGTGIESQPMTTPSMNAKFAAANQHRLWMRWHLRAPGPLLTSLRSWLPSMATHRPMGNDRTLSCVSESSSCLRLPAQGGRAAASSMPSSSAASGLKTRGFGCPYPRHTSYGRSARRRCCTPPAPWRTSQQQKERARGRRAAVGPMCTVRLATAGAALHSAAQRRQTSAASR